MYKLNIQLLSVFGCIGKKENKCLVMVYACCWRKVITTMKRIVLTAPLVLLVIFCYYCFTENGTGQPKKDLEKEDLVYEQKLKQLESLRGLIDHGGAPHYIDIRVG